MINTILWILIGIPTGYILMNLINYYYSRLYNNNISNYSKYNIIICITFLAFLRGYTGNDLVTNINFAYFAYFE